MSIYTVFVWVAIFVVISYIVHEYGHALAAKLIGWETAGFVFRWYGAGYRVKINQDKPEDIWKVALGGILATQLLCGLGYLISLIYPIFYILYEFNLFIFLFVILPFKKFDGYYLVQVLLKPFKKEHCND